MQKLISELMEFRKTKSSNMDLHPENVNVKSLMEYASNNYVDILKENKIDFKVETHDTSEIYSDRNALEKNYIQFTVERFQIYSSLWIYSC